MTHEHRTLHQVSDRSPEKTLQTAATTARSVGWVCLALSTISMCAIFGALGRAPRFLLVVALTLMVVMFTAPAVTYLLLGSRIRVGRRSAVITTTIVASLQLLLIGLALVGQLVGATDPISLVVGIILTLLLILLIFHISRCFTAIHQVTGPRGFEPLMPQSPAFPPSATSEVPRPPPPSNPPDTH